MSQALSNSRKSRYAIASLVVGLISLFVGVLGALMGPISVVLGAIAVRNPSGGIPPHARKIAIVGIILGGVAASLAVTIYDWNAVFDDTPAQETHLGGPAHFP
jgi:hypothetical protein